MKCENCGKNYNFLEGSGQSVILCDKCFEASDEK